MKLKSFQNVFVLFEAYWYDGDNGCDGTSIKFKRHEILNFTATSYNVKCEDWFGGKEFTQ